MKTKPFTIKLLLPRNKFQQSLPHIFISTKTILVTIADVELAIVTMESQIHFQSQLPYLFIQLPWLVGVGTGEGGGGVGAYLKLGAY